MFFFIFIFRARARVRVRVSYGVKVRVYGLWLGFGIVNLNIFDRWHCRTIISIATPALGTGSTATIHKQDGGALASSPSGRGSFQFLHRVQCFYYTLLC